VTSELPLGASLPDASGHFDRFGGRFVPEALFAALLQLEEEFRAAVADPRFTSELSELLADYTGRPSPITEAKRFSEHAAVTPAGQLPRILLKREDLNHTGSHKINNVLGQALLTRRQVSMASRPPLPPRCSGSTAPSTWARSTPNGRPSTSHECGCSVLR
jgi:tryptophan synthase beta chain